jgi:hypothetical protein
MTFISRVKSVFGRAPGSEKNQTLADDAATGATGSETARMTPANRLRGGADDNDVACLVFIFGTLGFNASDPKSMHDSPFFVSQSFAWVGFASK